MRAGILCPKCDSFACLRTRQYQNELHLKRWFFFFLPTSVSSVSRSQAHLAKWKRIGWSIGFNSWTNWTSYQGLYTKFVSMTSPNCSVVENDGELMLMALHTYSRVHALILAFPALVYRWGCQFLSISSQDYEPTELTVLLFFQNPYAIFARILQYYHDFQSNVAIFPNFVQASTQPYSFGGRIKLIICQIRHELSVTIHEISTSFKK